jgi:hypothetical protein
VGIDLIEGRTMSAQSGHGDDHGPSASRPDV